MHAIEPSLKGLIRDVPDFPKPGIVFKDLTPLFADAKAFQQMIEVFVAHLRGRKIDAIAGIESRGFILAAPLAVALGVGLVLVRKRGKLPWHTRTQFYDLEYATDAVEVHMDAVSQGDQVVVVDDVLATGGTAQAACALLRSLGAQVTEAVFLLELGFLSGRKRIEGTPVFALLQDSPSPLCP